MRIFYTAFILASIIYQDCFAQNAGNPDVSWYDNNKTSFVISSQEQMLGLSKLTNEGNTFEGKNIFLINNISLDGVSWTPIGSIDNPFKGTFDGGFHKVTLFDVAPSEYGGMFGYVRNACINNVSVLCNKPIDNCQNFGAVVGASDSKTTITFCSHLDSLIVNGAYTVGGISATSDAYLSGCLNDGVIVCRKNVQSFVGGLVGVGAPTIENSQNKADIVGSVVVGGIVGKLSNVDNSILLSDCVNYGDISINTKSDNHAFQYSAGGIVGVAPYVLLNYCWNEGKISVQSYKDSENVSLVNVFAAGLVGEGAGKIKYCYNTGEVFVRNIVNTDSKVAKVSNVAAGIIGMNTEKGITEISFSYNSGKVLTFGQAPIKVAQNYGGIVGDFNTFMPKLTGVYSLEGCCNVLESNGSTVTSTCNNAEVQVSKEQMSSFDFLVPVKSTITLNNDLVYLHDTQNNNDGLPVLKRVVTSVPVMNDDGAVVFNGLSKISGKRYFKYWITGMESYSVDLDVNDSFSYNIGKTAVGEHNVRAYIVLPDNSKLEGEKLSFVLRDKDGTFQTPVISTEVNNNTVTKNKGIKRGRFVSRRR